MRNIGPVSRRWLAEVEIHTVEDLRACGAAAVYRMVRDLNSGVSRNLLWALEGAVQDVHWRVISPERKAELLREVGEA